MLNKSMSSEFMWKTLNINSKKSTVNSRVALYSTWNTHICTLFPHGKNNMWMHVETKREIYSQKNPELYSVWPNIPHKSCEQIILMKM